LPPGAGNAQQRGHADALADHPARRRKPSAHIRQSGRAECRSSPYTDSSDPQRHQRIDLRAFAWSEPNANNEFTRVPPASTLTDGSQIAHQRQRAERSQQRRQQERDPQVAGQRENAAGST
jgi:hypothetical protein